MLLNSKWFFLISTFRALSKLATELCDLIELNVWGVHHIHNKDDALRLNNEENVKGFESLFFTSYHLFRGRALAHIRSSECFCVESILALVIIILRSLQAASLFQDWCILLYLDGFYALVLCVRVFTISAITHFRFTVRMKKSLSSQLLFNKEQILNAKKMGSLIDENSDTNHVQTIIDLEEANVAILLLLQRINDSRG